MSGKKMQTRMNGFRRLWVVAILLCSSCSGKNQLIGCSSAGDQGASTHPASFSLPIVHKYSPRGRELLMKARGLPPVGDNKLAATAIAEWPLEGTREYYDMLRRHDHARLHGGPRQLLAGNTVYTFAAGNETEQPFFDLLYAFVKIGTPGKQYLVALDTGTDLLWLPCECQHCSPLSVSSLVDPRTNNLNEYSASLSSTSKEILCNDTLCINLCATAADQCPYTQDYNYLNTFNNSYVYNASSSGVLFEDNLYLRPEKGGRLVSAPVVIGCGQTQTGGFLQGIAPDGVLGLGSGIISVPSALRRAGVVASFSICLNPYGYGRIAFGDIGPVTQQTVPLLRSSSDQQDAVEIETIQIGSKSIQVSSTVSFDTGLTYTYLATPIFEQFITDNKAQIPDVIAINYLDWGSCFTVSPTVQLVTPTISLTFPNGNDIGPIDEFFTFPNQTGNGITLCVGILDGGHNTIIGRMYFNSAYNTLGSNCCNHMQLSELETKGIQFWNGASFWNYGLPMGRSQRMSAGTSILVDKSLAPLISANGILLEENFMQGFSFTFNRAKQFLGWTQTDCDSDLTRSAPTTAPAPSVVPPSSTPPPASTSPALSPGPSTTVSNVPPPSGGTSTSPTSAAGPAPKTSSATATAHYIGVTKSVDPISPILSMFSLLVFLVCLITLL